MAPESSRIRSPPLLAIGLLLLAGSGVIAAVLQGGLPATQASFPDDASLSVAGTLGPLPAGRDSPATDPALRALLSNHTYVLRGVHEAGTQPGDGLDPGPGDAATAPGPFHPQGQPLPWPADALVLVTSQPATRAHFGATATAVVQQWQQVATSHGLVVVVRLPDGAAPRPAA